MSYCRFSSMDFGCDLYCFADCAGGYTTYVAANKIVGEVPKIPEFPLGKQDTPEWKAWGVAYKAQMDFLETAKRVPIGLPYDGERFNDLDLESFLARLLMLRERGYRFPDYVLEDVRSEIEEERKSHETKTKSFNRAFPARSRTQGPRIGNG